MANQPVGPLLASNVKGWISAKGFMLVTAAALLPLGLTGAWVATHQSDLTIVDLTRPPDLAEEGTPFNFTATVKSVGNAPAKPANVTLRLLDLTRTAIFGGPARQVAENTTRVGPLAVGDTANVTLPWTTEYGIFLIVVFVDADDEVGELNEEEEDNVRYHQFLVNSRPPPADFAPPAPAGLAGNATANRTVDLRVTSISWTPTDVVVGTNTTFTMNVTNDGPDPAENATLTLRVVGPVIGPFGAANVPGVSGTDVVTVPPGVTRSVNVTWRFGPASRAEVGAYFAEGFVDPGTASNETNATDNHRAEGFALKAKFVDPPKQETPAKITLKKFYRNILSGMYIPIVVPFIGLFYAAGVLSDEKDRGALPYLLTRPVKRWLIPLTKFASSFLIAALASLLGLIAAFLILVGQPEADLGFFTTSLLLSLLALFAYGAFFILLGVLVERPYIVGAVFVLAWETLAPQFAPWVKNLTLSSHLQNALAGWSLEQGVLWLPEGEGSLRAIYVLLAAGVGFLIAAAYVMRRKEFDV